MHWKQTSLLFFMLIVKTYGIGQNTPFLCLDGEIQIGREKVCDGSLDCPMTETSPGGDDEQDCRKGDLPRPKIVIVGATGTGKSSMANSVLGLDPEMENAMFTVCHGMDSCTKETSYGVGKWLGKGINFTVVDTPGFGDSDNEDAHLINEMLSVLKNKVKNADAIVLLIKGSDTRFTAGLQSMLIQMSSIFGERWWDFLIKGVSFWEFDKLNIKKRKRRCPGTRCKDESWFKSEIQHQLLNKFNLKKNFTFAFVHSYSQIEENKDDPLQQKHWLEETEVLWNFTNSKNSTFEFKDIDDILEENYRMKREVTRLNVIIEKNITELTLIMRDIQTDINENTKAVKIDVESNKIVMKSNAAAVSYLKQKVGNLATDLGDLKLVPLGTIIAWVNKPSSDGKFVDLPSGWQRCDGSSIPHPSIWAGKLTPDLNGEKRFLRGGPDKDILTLQMDMINTVDLDHNHKDPGHSHTDRGHSHSGGGHTHSDGGHTHTQDSHSHSGPGHLFVVTNPPGSSKTTMWLSAQDKPKRYYSGHQESTTASKTPNINSASANIQTGRASIQTGHASISKEKTGLDSIEKYYKIGYETRPKNMIVTYIMRIF